jgi:hypothetical protein
MRCPFWHLILPMPSFVFVDWTPHNYSGTERCMDRSIGDLSNNNGTRPGQSDAHTCSSLARKRGCNGVRLVCCVRAGRSIDVVVLVIKHAPIISRCSASLPRPCPGLGPTSHGSHSAGFISPSTDPGVAGAQLRKSIRSFSIRSTAHASALATLTIAPWQERGTKIFARKFC